MFIGVFLIISMILLQSIYNRPVLVLLFNISNLYSYGCYLLPPCLSTTTNETINLDSNFPTTYGVSSHLQKHRIHILLWLYNHLYCTPNTFIIVIEGFIIMPPSIKSQIWSDHYLWCWIICDRIHDYVCTSFSSETYA